MQAMDFQLNWHIQQHKSVMWKISSSVAKKQRGVCVCVCVCVCVYVFRKSKEAKNLKVAKQCF